MFNVIPLAWRNVLQHRRRSFLVGATIGAVTLLLTVLLGIINAAQIHLYETATVLYAGDLNIDGVYKPTPARAEPVLFAASGLAAQIKSKVPEVVDVVSRRVGISSIASGTASIEELIILGVDVTADHALSRVVKLSSGRLEDLSRGDGVLISEKRAQKLHVRVGDPVTLIGLNHKKVYNAVDAQVVGIVSNGFFGAMEFTVITSLGTIGKLLGFKDDEVSSLQLYFDRRRDLGQLQARIRSIIAAASLPMREDQRGGPWWMKKSMAEAEPWTGEKIDVLRWDEEVPFQSTVLSVVNAAVSVLTFILLLVAGAGLMNTLWLAVRERTPEIGTLRAIGMSRRAVVMLFLVEAFLLAIFGMILGVVVGFVAGHLVNLMNIAVPGGLQLLMGMDDRLRFVFAPGSIITAALLIAIAVTLISMVPSYLASRIQPITAMQRAE